ncbi:MAG: acyl carrier protein [Pseudonocardia sp.]|nr:acyl carrier protein [Pseudonocardia sp.]
MSIASAQTPESPETVTTRLAALWRDLFADPGLQLSDTDNFFSLGASSLLAMTLVERLRGEFGIPVSLKAVLENPQLGALAAHLTTRLFEGEHGEL